MAEKLPIDNFMKNSFRYFVTLIILFSVACKTIESTSTIEEKPSKEFLINYLSNKKVTADWFSAKAKVQFTSQDKLKHFTVNIRMRSDSILWASFTGLMGIEAARVMIRKDSVFIIDKMNKQVMFRSVGYIDKYMPLPFEINFLQDLLLGNVFIKNEDAKVKFKQNRESYILTTEDKLIKNEIQINRENYSVSTQYLADKQADTQLSLIFTDYIQQQEVLFSYHRNISFTGTEQVEIGLKFSKVKWNEPRTFPFHFNSNYEKL